MDSDRREQGRIGDYRGDGGSADIDAEDSSAATDGGSEAGRVDSSGRGDSGGSAAERAAADRESAATEAAVADGYTSPTAIASMVKLGMCERAYAREFNDYREEWTDSREFAEEMEPLSPLLTHEGDDFEAAVVDEVRSRTGRHENHGVDDDADDEARRERTRQWMRECLSRVRADAAWDDGGEIETVTQLRVRGRIGTWNIEGDADLVMCFPTGDGVRVHIIDVKSAFGEKTHHQLQVTQYAMLFEQMLDAVLPDDASATGSTASEGDGASAPDDGGGAGGEGGGLPRASDVTVTGGVYHRETEVDGRGPDAYPSFALAPRKGDLRRLTSETGEMNRLAELDDEETVREFRPRCRGCTYQEACRTEAVENESTALLGITAGAQRALSRHGIDTVEEVAALADVPEERTPVGYDTLPFARDAEETVRALLEEPAIGPQLSETVQRAQTLAGDLSEDAAAFHLDGGRTMPWLIGAGSGGLPEDTEIDGVYDPEIVPDSMVRVYLHVHVDHRRDRISLMGAFITSTLYGEAGNDPIRISEMVSEIGADAAAATETERDLLCAFFEDVFEAVRTVAAATGCGDAAALHFYTYTGHEANVLDEALARHDDAPLPAVRDLLGLRRALGVMDAAETADGAGDTDIDHPARGGTAAEQSMLTVIENEVRNRLAPRTVNDGLLPVAERIANHAEDGSDFFLHEDTVYTRSDGEEVNLASAFRAGFMGQSGKFGRTADGGLVKLPIDADNAAVDEWRPTRARHRVQMPTEYVWAACGEIDEEWVDRIDDPWRRTTIRSYIYRTDAAERPLTREDVMALAECLAHALAHVERGLDRRNFAVDKRPLDLDALAEFSHDEAGEATADEREDVPSIARSMRELLHMEHDAGREEARATYRAPVRERVRGGKSTYFEVDETADTGTAIRVTGTLLYDADDRLTDEGARRAARECKVKAGDRMVANRLRWMRSGVDHVDADRPSAVERGPSATVIDIDTTGPPGTRTVTVDLRKYTIPGKFTVPHATPTDDPSADGPNVTVVTPGARFVLDPLGDDFPSQKYDEALSLGTANAVCDRLAAHLNGTPPDAPAVARRPHGRDIERFCDAIDAAGEEHPDIFPLNDEQRAFVTRTDAPTSLLQGPPGTGKTAGALAPALLGRAVCAPRGGRAAGAEPTRGARIAATGPSNTAVDELAGDLATLAEALEERDGGDALGDAEDAGALGLGDRVPAVEDVQIVRLTGGDHDRPHDRIDYVNLRRGEPDDSGAFAALVESLTDESAAGDGSATLAGFGGVTPVIVLGTPYRLWTLFDKLPEGVGTAAAPPADGAASAGAGDDDDGDTGAIARLRRGERHFDVFAADEASMLRLPEFAAAGAFVRADGQLLIAGDQRQMPPVFKHEWDAEMRRTIRETLAHLSTLDYHRLLRGDEVDIDADALAEFVGPRDEDIPMTRLRHTYRCHRGLARFLSKHIYERLDGLEYISAETATLDPDRPPTAGQRAVVAPEVPVSVVVYDDREGREANPTEAALIEAAHAPIADEHSVGVVTPHNAQKGLIRRTLPGADADGETADTLVETVERFQGGERDAILISATVSDPAFLRDEEDFILDLNRLNVAMSRARRKLVVVVARSVFQLLPVDADVYEESMLWKALYHEAGVDGGADAAAWSGSLAEFVDGGDIGAADGDTHVEVHHIPPGFDGA